VVQLKVCKNHKNADLITSLNIVYMNNDTVKHITGVLSAFLLYLTDLACRKPALLHARQQDILHNLFRNFDASFQQD
jgi:hypothetical protein